MKQELTKDSLLSAVKEVYGNRDKYKDMKSQGFGARKDLLAGDIQVAKGDVNGAKSSFENAQKNGNPLEKQMAQMKLNNL